MSNNTILNIGIGGDVIATEDPGLGYKLPVSKIRTGAIDIDGGDVTIGNPFPVSTFQDEFGNLQMPTIRIVDGLWTMFVRDNTNREYHERTTLAVEALFDVENTRTNPSIVSSTPTPIDFGMVVRHAGPVPLDSDITGSGAISALNQLVLVQMNGVSTIIVNIFGTWVGTLTFQGSIDGVTWIAITGQNSGGTFASTTTVNATFILTIGGYSRFRIIATAWTSGQASINYNVSCGENLSVVIQPTAASLQMTATQGTAASLANAWSTKITDATNGPVAVKASGITPLTTDASMVVSLSPNTWSLVGAVPKTNPVPVASLDITNTLASISSTLLNGQARLQVNDDQSRLLLEQVLLLLVDIRSILAATTLKGETVSLANIDTNNGN